MDYVTLTTKGDVITHATFEMLVIVFSGIICMKKSNQVSVFPFNGLKYDTSINNIASYLV
jgi:hypothetical protein